MATGTIKASDIVSNNIGIPNQDTTYLSGIQFRKIGRVVYMMSRAIKVYTAITSGIDITLGTVPDEIKPIDTVNVPMFNRNTGTFGELMISTDGTVKFNKRSGTFSSDTYCTVQGYCYISAN